MKVCVTVINIISRKLRRYNLKKLLIRDLKNVSAFAKVVRTHTHTHIPLVSS